LASSESLRTEFVGTGIHASVVLPVSTETEFRDAMARDYGHSCRGSARSRAPTPWPQRCCAASTGRLRRCTRIGSRRALTVINAWRQDFADGLVRKFGRRREK
jgi:short-subunit dehydrogenase